MKEWLGDILASVAVGLLLPGLILNGAAAHSGRETAPEQPPAALGALDSYLVGVLLAEMPAWFEPEALKAQAVAARTYAWKARETGGKHGDGTVCGNSGCCQGYLSREDYLQQGGAREDVDKIEDAVRATANQVLTYRGELIEAVYFSCSGGSTEDALAVWGQDFPYLRSVDSPGEEEAAYYRSQVTMTPRELEDRLGVTLSEDPGQWIGKVSYTKAGSVDTAVIGGKYFTGTEVRTLLGLRSAAFSLEASEQTVLITTKGYGHRVGMSQYGADAMALKGSSYPEILAHYYQGTELTRIDADDPQIRWTFPES